MGARHGLLGMAVQGLKLSDQGFSLVPAAAKRPLRTQNKITLYHIKPLLVCSPLHSTQEQKPVKAPALVADPPTLLHSTLLLEQFSSRSTLFGHVPPVSVL